MPVNHRLAGLALAAALAACATAEEAATEPRTVTFICPRAQLVTVTFTDGLARVVTEGVDAELAQQPSGSGFIYAGEGHSLRGKGTALTWTDAAGTVRECEDQTVSMNRPQIQEPVPELGGTAWRLAYFQPPGDAGERLVPPRIERYTVEFAADGAASLQLDCNRLNTRWTQTGANANGGAIAFSPGAMTRAFCGADAWDTRIAGDLERVRSFTIAANTLRLSLDGNAGTYVWTRAAGQ